MERAALESLDLCMKLNINVKYVILQTSHMMS